MLSEIPPHLTYLFVDFFTIIFPFIFSFTPWFHFKKYWIYFFPGNILIAILYLIWDAIYTHVGVWGFDYSYTLGVELFRLPLEEFGFFICTPFACVFTYFCMKKYAFKSRKNVADYLWLASAFSFLIVAFVYRDKLYTCASFMSIAIACLLAFRSKLLSAIAFYIYYMIIMIPFLIFNGILTGSFLHRVVVFYNDSENMGVRILTIPFEDIFYGMAMILLNILAFEYFLKRNKVSL
jgi:lycopene cyclase domain-containing protein